MRRIYVLRRHSFRQHSISLQNLLNFLLLLSDQTDQIYLFEYGVSEIIEGSAFYGAPRSLVGGNSAMVLKEPSQLFQTDRTVS